MSATAPASEPVTAYSKIPDLWNGDTVVVIGGGPSLTEADVDYCRDRAPVIAINDAYRLCGDWCTWLHACDGKWWRWHVNRGVLGLPCIRSTLDPLVPRTWARLFNNTGPYGFDQRRWCLRTGNSSGYQGVCIAMHAGARRILLLGFDCSPAADGTEHWFGDHPETYPISYQSMRDAFETLRPEADERSIEILNCSPGSALETFDMANLREAI